MSRPFFAQSIADLEAAFDERNAEPAFLDALAQELEHRSTDRAGRLAERVRLAHQGRPSPNPERPARAPAASTKRPPAAPPPPARPAPSPPPPASQPSFRGTPVDAPMPPMTNAPKRVLGAWTALEVLSPQTFLKPQQLASGGDARLVARIDEGVLPWERGEGARPHKQLFYHVVLGTVNAEHAFGALMDCFEDTRSERPSVRGEAITATIVLDRKGRLAGDSPVAVSSFAWGLAVALKGDLTALAGWSAVASDLQTKLDERLRRKDKEGEERPLDRATITDAHTWLVEQLAIPAPFITPPRYAIRAYEYFRSPEPPEPLLLNSFYLGDLARAQALFDAGKGPRNLRLFLGLDKPAARRDLFQDKAAVGDAVAPSIIPPARWPAPGRHPLVLLQQAAVNLALSDLKKGGILAVNGPPGTGKTTLLREVVAAVVTERAEAMLRFDDPAAAFTHSGQKIKAGNAWLHLYSVDAVLRGHEMIVASSNNKAVENVSAELPAATAVATDAGLSYFQPLSDALLERPTWGLIAAVLGNAANRGRFRKVFWWDKEVGLSTYLTEAAGTPQWISDNPADPVDGHRPRLVEEADAPDGHDTAVERWKKVRQSFAPSLKKSRTALKELSELRERVVRLPELVAADAQARTAYEAALSVEQKATRAVAQTKTVLTAAQTALQSAERRLNQHDASRPSFWARLFRSGPAKAWSGARDPLVKAVDNARSVQAERAALFQQQENIRQKAADTVARCLTESGQAHALHEATRKQVDAARARLEAHFIDDAFFAQPHGRRHKTVPWCDQATQRLRDDLFVAAMAVHKAFVDAAAKPIKHNLGALMNAMGPSGGPLTGPKAALLPDVWATLFLVVPVVSTTFASVERMMGALPPESLGWLLIDEAGQASPQQAVGALLRTRRAVVVGDPVQIEPVVPLPDSLTQTICRRFGIDPDHFNPPTASTQTLADAATPYFAEFQGRHGSRSVGVPLLVHRRCSEPMFRIANAVAYEGLMVQAKTPNASAISDCLGPSAWLHVEGTGRDKWCSEEGEVVLSLLRRLVAAGVPGNLYIVTPFVVVAENLRRLIAESGVLSAWTDDAYRWTSERIGTVHTVQGREAEAVILVLGAPDPQQRGARGWAGGRPNLLNVALTRAQEVVYVVGNRRLWREAGVFSQLDGGLP